MVVAIYVCVSNIVGNPKSFRIEPFITFFTFLRTYPLVTFDMLKKNIEEIIEE